MKHPKLLRMGIGLVCAAVVAFCICAGALAETPELFALWDTCSRDGGAYGIYDHASCGIGASMGRCDEEDYFDYEIDGVGIGLLGAAFGNNARTMTDWIAELADYFEDSDSLCDDLSILRNYEGYALLASQTRLWYNDDAGRLDWAYDAQEEVYLVQFNRGGEIHEVLFYFEETYEDGGNAECMTISIEDEWIDYGDDSDSDSYYYSDSTADSDTLLDTWNFYVCQDLWGDGGAWEWETGDYAADWMSVDPVAGYFDNGCAYGDMGESFGEYQTDACGWIQSVNRLLYDYYGEGEDSVLAYVAAQDIDENDTYVTQSELYKWVMGYDGYMPMYCEAEFYLLHVSLNGHAEELDIMVHFYSEYEGGEGGQSILIDRSYANADSSSANAGSTGNFSFRNGITWGMTLSEVSDAEGISQTIYHGESAYDVYTLQNIRVGNFKASLDYYFADNRLVAAVYDFADTDYSAVEYLYVMMGGAYGEVNFTSCGGTAAFARFAESIADSTRTFDLLNAYEQWGWVSDEAEIYLIPGRSEGRVYIVYIDPQYF